MGAGRWRRGAAALVVAVAGVTATSTPAAAACHVAAFVAEDQVEVAEAAGSVTITVELLGRQPSCAGTVDVATVDGSATAGEDYEAVSETLSFPGGGARTRDVTITILDDDLAEGPELFDVELSNPTGDVESTGGPATVRVEDDDGADDDGADDDGADDGTGEPTIESPDAGASDPVATTGAADAGSVDEDEEGGAPIAAIGVVLGLALGAGIVVARRRGG